MSAQERSNVITRVEQTQWGKRRPIAVATRWKLWWIPLT